MKAMPHQGRSLVKSYLILFANDLLTSVVYLNRLVNSYRIELEEGVRMSSQFVHLCSTLLNLALAVLNPASRHPVC